MNDDIVKVRIIEENLKNTIEEGDVLLVDNPTNGTSKVPASLLFSGNAFRSYSLVINASTYLEHLPDANDVMTNTVYRLNFAFASTEIPANLPITSWICRNIGSLYTYVTNYGERSAGDYQVFITSENIWTRVYTTSWQSWLTLGQLDRFPSVIQTVANVDTYATVLPDVNDIMTNSIYRLNFAFGATNIPAHLPISSWICRNEGVLYSFISNSGIRTSGDYQVFITSENIWTRVYTTSWQSWLTLGQLDRFPNVIQTVVNADTYASVLPDANAVSTNSVYRLNYSFGATNLPANLPISSWICRNLGALYTFVSNSGTHSAGDYQVFITSENIWTRVYTTSWQSWITLGQLSKYPESIQTVINAGNYSSLLSSANNVTTNSVHRLNFAKGVTNFTGDLPFTKWESDRVVTLITNVTNVGIHSSGDTQTLVTSENVWTRNYLSNAWSEWSCITGGREYIVDINGSGDYTSLYACIVEAMKFKNSVVRVKKGTYDVINELKDLKGSDYFTNFVYATDAIILDNGIHIIGEPGVLITALFDSPVNNVSNYFSPFDIRFDCTLENLEIHAKNCRYCIHDDQWDRTTPYTHIFKNLKLLCDNSGNTIWTRRLAFGGGLGACGHIEFHNCYFESVGLDGSAYSGYGSMGYHNSPVQGENDIIVNNCYFAGNSTFRFTYMGSYTNKSTAFVSGCSFGRAMEIDNERDDDTIVNVEIIDCNNKIRT